MQTLNKFKDRGVFIRYSYLTFIVIASAILSIVTHVSYTNGYNEGIADNERKYSEAYKEQIKIEAKHRLDSILKNGEVRD